MFNIRAIPIPPSGKSPLLHVAGWPKLPADFRLDRVAGIVRNSQGHFYVAHRGEKPLFCMNADGTLRGVVGANVLKKTVTFMMKKGKIPDEMEALHFMHGLSVDPWDNVWVTDVGRHLVMRFDSAGALTLTLGLDGEAGCDDRRFNQPTSVCVVPSGDIFVTDGYGNSRIVKFTPDGKFIKAWGQRGIEPGQFHTPHVIVQGRRGHLYVSDRENDRIQIFDLEGELIAIWGGLYSVDGLCLAPDGTLYGSVGATNSIFQFDSGGGTRRVWVQPELMDYPHGICVDGKGFIYVSETGEGPKGDRILKLQRSED
jgi:hypothetical protein